MAGLKIEQWPIEKLTPYARNPRKNDEAVPKMAGLIREFGFKVPVVVRSDGEVVDGHLRLKAARHLGMESVPVVLADEWTPQQVKAFRIAVNKSAEWAEWDEELLSLELEDLKADDFDLELIGFEPADSNTSAGEYDKYEQNDDSDEDDDISEFVGHDDDYLLKKRVILTYSDDEEQYLRKNILHIGNQESLVVTYDVSEIMYRDGQGGNAE